MKKYYLHDGVAQQGPFDLEELKAKNISVNTNVWFDPMPGWNPAGTIDELKSIFNSGAPPALDLSNKQFYFSDSSGQHGPFKLEELKGKNIVASTPVWYDPLPKWTTAGEIPALKAVIGSGAASHTAAPATEDWNNKQYYYSDSGGQHGPFKLSELKGKNIVASTPVWYDPLPKWTTAGEVAALKAILTSAASHTVAPAAEDWNNKQYYYSDSGGQHGPYKLSELKGKNIVASTPVWYDPLPKWTTAGELAALKDIITSTAPHVIAPAAEDWNNKQYYYSDSGGQHGPFTLSELKGKNIVSSTPVWYDPLPKWTTAGEVTALRAVLTSAASAPHTAAPAAEDWHNKLFYYNDGTGQHGPFKMGELKGKNIVSSTPVWYDPLPKWTTAGEVAALKDIITSTATVSHTASAEDWSNKNYFYADSTGQHGPFKLSELKEKNIISSTPVWYDPLPKWTTAGEVDGLKDIINTVS